MRLPRVRFTIKRMMIAVAVVAITLALSPVGTILKYLYKYPFLVNNVLEKVMPRDLGLKGRLIPVNRAVPIHCPYEVAFTEFIPEWMPYWVTIEVQLIDEKTRAVEEVHRNSRYLMAGRDTFRNHFDCELTPRHAGAYRVRYEMRSTDLLGRKTRASSIQTQYFEAR